MPDTTGFIRSQGQRLQKALDLAGEERRGGGVGTSKNRQTNKWHRDVTLDSREDLILNGDGLVFRVVQIVDQD